MLHRQKCFVKTLPYCTICIEIHAKPPRIHQRMLKHCSMLLIQATGSKPDLREVAAYRARYQEMLLTNERLCP